MTNNIPLRPNFQIVFSARNVVDFLRKENILRFYRKTMIGERIMNFLHADGGMLLLCGRMGVGKTSFINEMLADLKLDKHFIVLDIKLNVCRPIDTTQLLYRLIRKTYHASKDIKSDQTEILR